MQFFELVSIASPTRLHFDYRILKPSLQKPYNKTDTNFSYPTT